MADLDLVSSSSPDECARRLRAELGDPFDRHGRRPMLGWVLGGRWVFARRGRTDTLLSAWLWARLSRVQDGARIRGVFTIGPLPMLLLIAWSAVAGPGAIALIRWGVDSGSLQSGLIDLGGPIVLFIAIFAIRRLGRNDIGYVSNFVVRTLKAKDANQP